MDNIVSVTGKLLFFARHLASSGQINKQQLAILKDLIISGNDEVMAAYEEYLTSGTELTLASSVIRILHQEKDSESDGANSQGSRKTKRTGIKIVIPKRNIQKLPAGMERL